MENLSDFTQPNHLKLGQKYVRIERQRDLDRLETSPVILAGYDPCPAFVIVQDPSGLKLRCPRHEIFSGREQ